MLLFENVYLVIGQTELLLHDNGKETRIEWDDLESIALDEARGVLEFREEHFGLEELFMSITEGIVQ